MTEHNNRVALVTGGSRGIGAAIVRRLSANGFAVAFTYATSVNAAMALTDEIRAQGGLAASFQADNADDKALRTVVASVVEQFGRLDVLVNNAGGGTFGPLEDMPTSEIFRMIDVNIRGLVVATKAAIPHLGSGGRIINIGSVNADRTPFPGGSIYSMTKGAVAGFTRALSRELGPQGITVNNVQPGPISAAPVPPRRSGTDALRAQIAVDRYGTTSEVAAFVAYLTGDDAGYITGASLNIDGGFSA